MSEQAEPFWPSLIEVHTSTPVLACLGSQYAGWSLAASKEETGGKKFFSLGSGPARALAVKEPLFDELGYRDRHERGALVMEVDRLPPQVVIDKVLRDCALAPDNLTLIVTPTHSVAGTVQVVARVRRGCAAQGACARRAISARSSRAAARRRCRRPRPTPSRRWAAPTTPFSTAAACTSRVRHDAVARAARRASCRRAIRATTGGRSPTSSRSFNYDFYQIDPALFAPAEVWVSSLESGATWHGGRRRLPGCCARSGSKPMSDTPAHRDHDRRNRLAHAPPEEGVPRARRRGALRRSRRLPHRHDVAAARPRRFPASAARCPTRRSCAASRAARSSR